MGIPNSPLPERESYTRHRRDLAWKILFPVILFSLIVVGMAVVTAVAGYQTAEVGRWSAISAIWLILPVMVLGLIFLALTIALIVLFSQLLEKSPPVFGKIQDTLLRVNARIVLAVDKVVDPILTVQSWSAGVRSLSRRKKPKKG